MDLSQKSSQSNGFAQQLVVYDLERTEKLTRIKALKSILSECKQVKIELKEGIELLNSDNIKERINDKGLAGRLARMISGAYTQISKLDSQ